MPKFFQAQIDQTNSSQIIINTQKYSRNIKHNKISDLKKLASMCGIKGFSSMKKNELALIIENIIVIGNTLDTQQQPSQHQPHFLAHSPPIHYQPSSQHPLNYQI